MLNVKRSVHKIKFKKKLIFKCNNKMKAVSIFITIKNYQTVTFLKIIIIFNFDKYINNNYQWKEWRIKLNRNSYNTFANH